MRSVSMGDGQWLLFPTTVAVPRISFREDLIKQSIFLLGIALYS